MASLRFRNGKWQVQVRRHGHTQQAKSFQSKSDAQRWARQIEAELDRTLIPNDIRSLNTITVARFSRAIATTSPMRSVGLSQSVSGSKYSFVNGGVPSISKDRCCAFQSTAFKTGAGRTVISWALPTIFEMARGTGATLRCRTQ